MSIIEKLASSLGRKDEVPNQELAGEIVQSNNWEAVEELIENLQNKDKNIQHDCIKVLYEIGEKQAKLIADHLDTFVNLLNHKNNRLQWGGMTAIHYISTIIPDQVYQHLTTIVNAADKGSVITKDHAVNILISLAKNDQYAADAFTLLMEQMLKCPSNQLPMYAERSLPIITAQNKAVFEKLLRSRLDDFEKESKRKRVLKVIAKVQKLS